MGCLFKHHLVSFRTACLINAEVVCESLVKISATYPGEEMTVVMDTAQCQRSRMVMEITAEFDLERPHLPAYSPNLHLIGRVWRLVKAPCFLDKHLRNFTLFTCVLEEFRDSLNGNYREHVKALVIESF
jgi:hypothetical protein